MSYKSKNGITVAKATSTSLIALLVTLVTSVGCGELEPIHDAVYGDYHRLSPEFVKVGPITTNTISGLHITFRRYATEGMTAFFNICKSNGKSNNQCGTETLSISREQITKNLHGNALDLWNGDYSIFGFHPDIGKGFNDDEGPDFALAVHDLTDRTDECLRILWRPSGTNWTTVDDEGVAECDLGEKLELK